MATAVSEVLTSAQKARSLRPAIHIPIVAVFGMILTLPAIIYGLPFFGDDSTVHSLWYTNFAHQLWSGELYPRWLLAMNGGLGSPAFFYYPPASYFLTSLLHPFFNNDPLGYHQLGLAVAIALVASGLSAYLWLRQITSRNAAFVAALLYMALPYHLAADLYVRAAFAESFTFVWIPLILYFTIRIMRGSRSSVIGLAISYFLLIVTHLPTTVMFSVVPLGYALYRSERGVRTRSLFFVISGMVLGIGLSAIYLLPALTTQRYVFLNTDATGYFYYKNWFLFTSGFGEDKLAIGIMVFDTICLAACAFIISRNDSKGVFHKESVFWFGLAVLSTFMITPLASPVYKLIPVLQKIQFPWRFSAILCVATTGLLGLAVEKIKRPYLPRIATARFAGVLLILPWLPMAAVKAYDAYPMTHPSPSDVDYINRWLAEHRDAPEYRPRWSGSMASIDKEMSLDEKRWETMMDQEMQSLLHNVGDSNFEVKRISNTEGTSKVEIQQWKARDIILRTSGQDITEFDISQFYYPGWTATMVGENRDIDLVPSRPNGLLHLTVPAGDHEVELKLDKMLPERAGQVISKIALLVLASLIIYFCWPSRSRNRVEIIAAQAG